MNSSPANFNAPVVSDFLGNKVRIRVSDLQEAKRRGEKWAMLTCYDSITARIFDHAKIPCLLVGDSAAQTVYGYKSTIPVTMDELIPLARAVSSGCNRALIVADLPFGSYHESPGIALRSATRFMKEAGAHAVKLEGGQEIADQVRLLTKSGIPVMAHIGFTPQSEHALSGYKIQGRDDAALDKLIGDAKCLEMAGAFACVIEMVPSKVGQIVSKKLNIPTVGIGAGPDCDAQVLVWQDMAGFGAPNSVQKTSSGYLGGVEQGDGRPVSDNLDVNQRSSDNINPTKTIPFELARAPKFVKRYANLGEMLYNAAIVYREDVRNGNYPAAEHCYE